MHAKIKHTQDITIFNTFIQTQRLYQLLTRINDSFDKERQDLINQIPLPTLDIANVAIRRDIARCGIMVHVSSSEKSPSKIGSVLAHHR